MPRLVGLWALTGAAWVLTFMGMFTIGIFVAPVAVALLVLSILLTVRRPDGWPAVAGLGISLTGGIVWLGTVLATAGPSQLSCAGSSGGPTVCTSQGRVVDPDAFQWGVAAPWFLAAVLVAVATGATFVLAQRQVRLTRDWARSP